MKQEIKAEDYVNGKRYYEIPLVNDLRHGLARWWYPNGKKEGEISYLNGQSHGLSSWWNRDGSLEFLRKWHQNQWVWKIRFSSIEPVKKDAEVELFFHPIPELS